MRDIKRQTYHNIYDTIHIKVRQISKKSFSIGVKWNLNCDIINSFSLLQGMVDFDGYYSESDPCLVCNNPEVPYTVSRKMASGRWVSIHN